MIQLTKNCRLILVAVSVFTVSISNNLQAQTFKDYQLPNTLNRVAAEQQLSKILFTSKPPTFSQPDNTEAKSEQIKRAVYEADARMAMRARLGFAMINPIRIPTRVQVIQDINRSVNRDAGTGVVVLPIDDGSRSFNLYQDLIEQYCTDQANTKCTQATLTAIDLWQLAGIYRAFANVLNAQDKIASEQYLDSLDQQWQSYKNDTIKLWPQEVLLSSMFFRQNQDGFTAPPNYKVLALRPALGLSYLSDGSPDFRPTINVDLLGLYWWQYNNNKAGKGRGLAASLVWAGDDTAYGITYHHNPKWSATLAHSSDNDIVLSLSFQLGYAFFK